MGSSGVNLDGVLLFGFLVNPPGTPWDFSFRLAPAGSASSGQPSPGRRLIETPLSPYLRSRTSEIGGRG